MARKRMIDPSIWQDEEFGSLSANAKVLFIGLFSNADDEGRIRASPAFIKSTIFMYDSLSLGQIKSVLDEVVEKMETIILYEVDKKEYIQLNNWSEYQKQHKDRVQLSTIPAYDGHLVTSVGQVTDNDGQTPTQDKISKDKIREGASLTYLKNIPLKDIDELVKKYDCSDYQIIQKGVQLANYCIAHGKKYKNYKAMLENALVKDFGIRHEATTMSPSRIDLPEISKEERQKALAKAAKMREELAAKFKAN